MPSSSASMERRRIARVSARPGHDSQTCAARMYDKLRNGPVPLPVLAALVILLVAGGTGLALSGDESKPATRDDALCGHREALGLPAARVRPGPEQQPAGQRRRSTSASPQTTGRTSAGGPRPSSRRCTRCSTGACFSSTGPTCRAAQVAALDRLVRARGRQGAAVRQQDRECARRWPRPPTWR